ncbi:MULTISPECIES: hypothetical protein [Methanosarcina]|nr:MULTISPECIES: hypothetical protein [Methanosarcina]
MKAALPSAFADDTPEDKSLSVLIQERIEKASISLDNINFIPLSAAKR